MAGSAGKRNFPDGIFCIYKEVISPFSHTKKRASLTKRQFPDSGAHRKVVGAGRKVADGYQKVVDGRRRVTHGRQKVVGLPNSG